MAATMSRWLLFRSASKQERDRRQLALQDASVVRLRELLSSSEGSIAAKQLVQGGELKNASEMVSDLYLRRWLIARNWDVPHTYSCILKHAAWRVRMMPNGYMDESQIQSIADKKVLVQGLDIFGRPLGIVLVRKHLTKNSTPRELMMHTCYAFEALVALADREKNPGSRVAAMFDLTDAGLANLDFAGLRLVLDTLTSHYVEVLDVMIMYNPPLVFWGLWNSFKVLLPEATRNKVIMVDPADIKQLQDIVPQEVLPVKYGGQAKPLYVDEAVRAFKLPPYPHLPELLVSPNASSGVDGVAESPRTVMRGKMQSAAQGSSQTGQLAAAADTAAPTTLQSYRLQDVDIAQAADNGGEVIGCTLLRQHRLLGLLMRGLWK
eukprot:GHUV01012260.1.p1 GENE.GHUV01012260.1~~GHUV01012260.1.p1  ORF type:complete len:378 (+),score=86.82 GHUV01012260.1:214-1347(+)